MISTIAISRSVRRLLFLFVAAWTVPVPAMGQDVRARGLGISLGILPPGPLNAITDVDGVEVGHATIVEGEGLLESEGIRAQGDPWMPCSEYRQEDSGSPTDVSGAGTVDADGPLARGYGQRSGRGSIIAVVATDAPLLPTQLKRVARRVATGLGRLGDPGANGSGDLYLAFSTANPGVSRRENVTGLEYLPNPELSPLFLATAEAAEEAVVNALVAAETMEGADRIRVRELPHDRLREILDEDGRSGSGSD